MKFTVAIIMTFAIILTILAYMKDPHLPIAGLKDGWNLFWGIFPALIFAFIAAGMIGKVLPKDLMIRLLGEESGMRGLITGTIAGALTPGGAFCSISYCGSSIKKWSWRGPSNDLY